MCNTHRQLRFIWKNSRLKNLTRTAIEQDLKSIVVKCLFELIKMKNIKILILLIFFFRVQAIKAQDFQIDKFSTMTLNSVSMNALMPENATSAWAVIRSSFGVPIKEYDTFIESNKKHFEYSGAEFIYDDSLGDFDLLVARITSPNYVFTYDGLQIKVDNNISTLSAKFPLQYGKKKEGRMFVSLTIADIWMTIYYDSNNIITKIELLQDLL